jgi:hypothetical protein
MDRNIPDKFFIVKKLKFSRFVPEKKIEVVQFNERLWKRLFPYQQNVKLSKLKLTNIGIYSIAKPFIVEALISDLTKHCEIYRVGKLSNLIITEAFGGVGGFSIGLAALCKSLNIVEVIPDHVNIIKNNLEVYGFNTKKTNITIYNKDYWDVAMNLQQDIIVADCPWSGPMYKNQDRLPLGINNVDIAYVINQLYNNDKFKIFILLAPWNFDIQNFLRNIESKNIIINKMEKHYFIFINNSSSGKK